MTVCLFVNLPLQREKSLGGKVGSVLHCMTIEIPQGDRRKGGRLATINLVRHSLLQPARARCRC